MKHHLLRRRISFFNTETHNKTTKMLSIMKFFVLFYACFLTQVVYAQSALINASPAQVRASQRFWKFNRNASLDFGVSGNATAGSQQFGTQNLNIGEGFSTATDFDGNLLFYTSATQTYDRLGNATPNGAITGSNSATQGVIIIPHLGNPDRYLTIYTSTNVGTSANGNLLYSVFDINQNGGLGDLVLKNERPNPTSDIIGNEMITYAPNATGDGFWIISAINNSTCSDNSYSCTATETRVYAIEVTFPGGNVIQFGNPVISEVANLFNGYGSIEFNNDYSRAIMLSAYFVPTPFTKAGLLTELNFNASTGVFTRRWTFSLPALTGSTQYYTADYSPSEEYIFVGTVFGNSFSRYNITSGNAATIQASGISKSAPNGSPSYSGSLRTGPNGRVYIASFTSSSIWELANPDNATGTFTMVSKSFGTGGSSFGLSQTALGVAVDYGDAPETFGTNSSNNGPRHRILYNSSGRNVLALGATANSEANGQPSASATGDVDDGVATFPTLSGGAVPQVIPSYSVVVSTTNALSLNANLSGWIDWNNNGTFDANEIATVAVIPGQTSATLTWVNKTLSGSTGTSSTFARFRISTETGLLATGPASNGEVEDYIIPFATPLPVTLAAFNVNKSEGVAVLSWLTTSEANSSQFEIERSANAKDWMQIGVVASNKVSEGRKTYNFSDFTPKKGGNFYRLKMVDMDGTFAYSQIRSVHFALETDLTTYPNPTSEKLMINQFEKVDHVTLYNTSGHKLLEQSTVPSDGIDVSKLDPGIYTVVISMTDGSRSIRKIIIGK